VYSSAGVKYLWYINVGIDIFVILRKNKRVKNVQINTPIDIYQHFKERTYMNIDRL